MDDKLLNERLTSLRALYNEILERFYRLYFHHFKGEIVKICHARGFPEKDFDFAFDEAFEAACGVVCRRQMQGTLVLTSSWRNYLFGVVKVCIFGKKGLKTTETTTLDDIVPPSVEQDPIERPELVKSKIKELFSLENENHKWAIFLDEILDYRDWEIAELLKTTEGTVGQFKNRGRNKLRENAANEAKKS